MISEIRRQKATADTEEDYLWFWCAGCGTHHAVPVTGPHKWGWNGSVESPTLTPSIKVTYSENNQVCHSILTDGQLHYQGDCTHKFAGQVVPLEQMP